MSHPGACVLSGAGLRAPGAGQQHFCAGPGLQITSVCFLRLSRSQQLSMKSVSALLLLLPVLLVLPARAAPGCGPCEPALCTPLPLEGCQTGSVLDYCGCCSVCAAAEGEACGGRRALARRCGPGLECIKSSTDKKNKQGVCVCKSDYEVCGSDGVTYRNGCGLKSASLTAQAQGGQPVTVQNKGRCATGESAQASKCWSHDRGWRICRELVKRFVYVHLKDEITTKVHYFWVSTCFPCGSFALTGWELLPALNV